MQVICRTNLDLRGESWPNELPAVPNVGDHVRSATKHGTFQLELQVVRVTWKEITDPLILMKEWVPEIELHMTNWQQQIICAAHPDGCKCSKGSICAFYHWYAPLVGTTASAFI
jgi:hypothetical protein